jgi:hypothetical protein
MLFLYSFRIAMSSGVLLMWANLTFISPCVGALGEAPELKRKSSIPGMTLGISYCAWFRFALRSQPVALRLGTTGCPNLALDYLTVSCCHPHPAPGFAHGASIGVPPVEALLGVMLTVSVTPIVMVDSMRV